MSPRRRFCPRCGCIDVRLTMSRRRSPCSTSRSRWHACDVVAPGEQRHARSVMDRQTIVMPAGASSFHGVEDADGFDVTVVPGDRGVRRPRSASSLRSSAVYPWPTSLGQRASEDRTWRERLRRPIATWRWEARSVLESFALITYARSRDAAADRGGRRGGDGDISSNRYGAGHNRITGDRGRRGLRRAGRATARPGVPRSWPWSR